MRGSPARHHKTVLRRVCRRFAQWSAGPVAAGMVLALAIVVGVEVTGPVRWLTTGLSLIPAVLVHWHSRDRDFTWPETCAIGLAAAVVAYAVIVVGVVTGATVTFAIYVAVQTGVLAAVAQLSAIVGLLLTAFSRRRPT